MLPGFPYYANNYSDCLFPAKKSVFWKVSVTLWNGESHHVGASIGIVLLDDQGCVDYKTHFRHADCACYKAKKAGRNRVVIYSKDKQAAGIFEPAIP